VSEVDLHKISFRSLFVTRRKWIASGRDGVGIPDASISPVDGEFAATTMAEHFACSIGGRSLRVVHGTGAIRTGTVDRPTAITVRRNVASIGA